MISHIAKSIVWLAGLLFGYQYDYLPLEISAYIKKTIPQQELQGALLSVFLILLILSIVYLLFRNNESSLTLKYGIYWDSNKNPHCPICKKPVNRYDTYCVVMHHEKGYMCGFCEKVAILANSNGEPVTPEEARKSLSWWRF